MADNSGTPPRSTADIAAALRRDVVDGGLAPGDRLGAERELAERFDVTRWVVRRALDQLETDGLILRTSGRSGGVFVAHKRVVRDLEELVGLPEYLQAQGLEAGTTVLGTRLLPAEGVLATALEIDQGTWLIEVERLRLAGGLPLSVESVRFPADMFPGLLDRSLVGSLYTLLEDEYGISRGEARETIASVPAGREHAAKLQVPVSTPLLAVDRVARLEDGRPFEASREHYRGDRVEITVQAHSSGAARRKLLPS